METNTFIGPSSNQAVGLFFPCSTKPFKIIGPFLLGQTLLDCSYTVQQMCRDTRTINNTNKKLRSALFKQITEEITTSEKDLNRDSLAIINIWPAFC
jgi:hypothetical protein